MRFVEIIRKVEYNEIIVWAIKAKYVGGEEMKLSKIKLCNFRSFGSDEQVIDIDNLTAFIGNNSSGKTAALSALNILFSENSGERNLKRSDFFLPKDKKPEDVDELSLYIEAVFKFDELIVEDEQKKYSVPPFFESMVVNTSGAAPYLRIRLEGVWQKSSAIEGSIDSRISYITCPEDSTIGDTDRRTAVRRDLDRIRMIYIPAVRDPGKQLKNVSGTMMYQIMNSINWSDTTQNNIKTKIQELNDEFIKEQGVTILKDSIQTEWKEYDSDVRYSKARLQFNSTDLDSAIKKSEVVFSPTVTGKEYSIDEMGDGLRSLFYISMVDSMLDVEMKIREEIKDKKEHLSFSKTPPVLTIIAVEEPENHIAPHLIGKLIGKLKDISVKCNSQTILTSRSPAIIKRIGPENLRYFRMMQESLSTSIRKITLPDNEKSEDQYKYIKEAVKAYPELYFAKLVVLCEGDSEEIVLPKFFELTGNNIDASGISIVPLGGRHVNHFWRLLNDLEIPHITLLDLDREREGGAWGRIKYALEQLVKCGYDYNKLLLLDTGAVMTQENFNNMHTWDVENIELMEKWLTYLEKYHVYYSAPLDVDFLMLEGYGEFYKSMLRGNEGPYIAKKGKIIDIEKVQVKDNDYEQRIKDDIASTLKEHGGDGRTYSKEQQKLMVWYNYFFLNRGKPSTHILAMSQIEQDELIANQPDVIKRLILDAKTQLAKSEVGGIS